MKQYSPARLTRPLRRAGAERGAGEFVEIELGRGFSTLAERLANIRATDPKAVRALHRARPDAGADGPVRARQFGTPNYAAHGGFCSVNMAAGMIYTIGGSFWEFGGPDLGRAKLFVMLGTAEDHHSNPMKMALAKFKRDGGASSPSIRCAPATRPSPTSGCRSARDRRRLLLAVIHEISPGPTTASSVRATPTAASW